ncbi:MAG TPA: glutamate 5-kinase [Kiloniellaceae bacterium]|nr:glutamate 5-kinase [Kiloniellaceae bacterium]HIP80753.1 glutamate 5-kinase [Kiloniellaceae bacterium]
MSAAQSEKQAKTSGGQDLRHSRRLVVKIGSALLVDHARGAIHRQWLDALTDDVAGLMAAGTEVVLVSSGAIALGRRHLGLTQSGLKLEEKQAAAATGQIRLAHAYQESLARHDISVAQILLTLDDTEERRRHLNARSTLNTLLKMRTLPVINENDTVATSEIRVGDNDRLAARVAAMLGADTLVLLSDIDGLYSADPRQNPEADFIPEVAAVTPEIEAMAGIAPSDYSNGGMVTKLSAAKVATGAGCRMVITDGQRLHPLAAVMEGARCTWFLASVEPRTARKRWIAGSLKPSGTLRLDAGALSALRSGKSLLPAGVTAVEGAFQRGDAVLVCDPEGREVARGLAAYSAADARRIIGHKSREIEAILGYRGREELIHRDDLVVS